MSIAIFVDTENLVGGLGRGFREVDLGRAVASVCEASSLSTADISHLSVYGPWHLKDRRLARVRSSIQQPPAELIETEITNGKSILDTKLVLDATLHDTVSPDDTYVIMSGDSDMIPLVRFLQARNRQVIGAGRPDSAGMIAEVCDSFVFLSATGRVKNMPLVPDEKQTSPATQLRIAVEEILGGNDELPAQLVAAQLGERTRKTFGTAPESHYEEVLGVKQFKKVIAQLFPDGQIRLSSGGGAVERNSQDDLSILASQAPAFRGASRAEGPEAGTELDVLSWDSRRMWTIDLPELAIGKD